MYGDVVRISPWQVAVADPEGFAAIHRIGSGFTKSKWYEEFVEGNDRDHSIGIGLFAMADPKAHAARRKLFARPFSQVSLRQDHESVIRDRVEQAVARIRDEALCDTADVLKWWTLMASDIIGHLSFGEPFGLLELGKVRLKLSTCGTELRTDLPPEKSLCRDPGDCRSSNDNSARIPSALPHLALYSDQIGTALRSISEHAQPLGHASCCEATSAQPRKDTILQYEC